MPASRATSRKLRDAILFSGPIKFKAAWNSSSFVIVAFRPTLRASTGACFFEASCSVLVVWV